MILLYVQSFRYVNHLIVTSSLIMNVFCVLSMLMEKYIFDVFKQYGWPFKADKVKINEMWSIINKKNSYNESHIHPNNLLSSVYYVRAPKDCGKIIFNNHLPL